MIRPKRHSRFRTSPGWDTSGTLWDTCLDDTRNLLKKRSVESGTLNPRLSRDTWRDTLGHFKFLVIMLPGINSLQPGHLAGHSGTPGGTLWGALYRAPRVPLSRSVQGDGASEAVRPKRQACSPMEEAKR